MVMAVDRISAGGESGYILGFLSADVKGSSAQAQGHDPAAPGYNVNHQYPAGMQQPPSLQDPASGAAQQAFSFMARYAGQ